ncbi:MAG: AMP-binding protein [Blastocatellia bacterium]|nr:AMP-binding protein [Blastocatellia bacterium]
MTLRRGEARSPSFTGRDCVPCAGPTRLAQACWRFARELQDRGIGHGDRVAIWGRNSPEWVAAFYGTLLRGAVAVPLDDACAPDFAVRVANQVAPRLLAGARGRSIGPDVPVIVLEDLDDVVRRHSDGPASAASVQPSDLAQIVFTSGTTAEPRGVLITHGNVLSNLEPLEREIAKYLKWERPFHTIRFLDLLPLSHVFGQFMGIYVPQLLGGEVHFTDSLNPSRIVETIRRERISVCVAVPRILHSLQSMIEHAAESRGELDWLKSALVAAEGQHPLRKWWRFRRVHRQFGWKFWAFVAGGATLDPDVELFWRQLGYAVVQGYGMTETASLVSVNHPFKMSRGSIGKVMPGQDVKLGPGGEIFVRGSNVTPGYWSSAGASERVGDDWFPTGDIGELDAEGNLFFKGRKKTVIVTASGLGFYPEDLEAALRCGSRDPRLSSSRSRARTGPSRLQPSLPMVSTPRRGGSREQTRHWPTTNRSAAGRSGRIPTFRGRRRRKSGVRSSKTS